VVTIERGRGRGGIFTKKERGTSSHSCQEGGKKEVSKRGRKEGPI